MIKFLVTWKPLQGMVGTYTTIEIISVNAPLVASVQKFYDLGAVSAEIIKTTMEG